MPPSRQRSGGASRGGGRGGRAAGGAGRGSAGVRRSRPSGLGADDYDEVDRFHASANKLSLRLDDGEEEDGGEEEEEDEAAAVFDLEDEEDEDEDEEEDDDDDDDDDGDATLQQMRRTKKAVTTSLLRQAAADADVAAPSDSDPEEAGRRKPAGWGKRKQAYYDDGDYQDTSDEDAALEEEQEALRLQRQAAQALRAADFDQDDVAEEGEEEADEEEELPASRRRGGKLSAAGMLAASRGAVVESLHADEDEDGGGAAAAAAGGAPELLALAEELKDALEEVRTRAGPLREAVQRGDFATKEGISYLDAKHLTLLSYCINIVFYILLKAQASGDGAAASSRVRDHPVVRRLLEARTYLEKARPIDKKMAYQLDRLLKMATDADNKATGHAGRDDDDDEDGLLPFDADDPMQLRPNVGALLSSRGGARAGTARGEGDGLYRPPKLVPARMGGDGEDDGEPGMPGAKRAARAEAERRRRAARSTLVRQLDEELTGAPQLVVSDLAAGGGAAAEDIGFIRREAARLARRAEQEEDLFARVPMSKQERQRSKAAERKATGMSAQVADFADDVADVVTAVQRLERAGPGGDDIPAPPTKRVKLSAIAAAAAVTAHNAHRQPASGDMDLPKRLDLGERRSAFERRPRPLSAAAAGDDDGDVDFDDGDPHFGGGAKAQGARRGKARRGEEEGGDGLEADGAAQELYAAALASTEAKRAKKRQLYDPAERFAPATVAPPAEVGEGERRGITGAMWTNRGLTPHRNKDKKNPRKKHRLAYADALVRRKGAVRDAATGPVAGGLGYAGEATGIKSTVVKSRRL